MMGPRSERPCGCVYDGTIVITRCAEHVTLGEAETLPPSYPPSPDSTAPGFALDLLEDEGEPTTT